MHEKRTGLFRKYLRLIKEILPKCLVLENVPGMNSVENGAAISEIKNVLVSLGYKVEMKILNAEDFGLAQERRRLFFLASRLKSAIEFPKPFCGDGKLPFLTVWDSISDLPKLNNREGGEEFKYPIKPQNQFQQKIRDQSSMIFNHVAPTLGQINLERLKHIPEGGSWRDIPNHLLPDDIKRAKRSDHTKRYGRLSKNGFA
jgi:DNA (cytosine-5)-methyltransferase 1